MNQIDSTSNQKDQAATTEIKSGRSRKGTRADVATGIAEQRSVPAQESFRETSSVLNANSHGKLVLFGVADRVEQGPVMRGFIEVKSGEGAPVKVNVAAWLKIGRSSGVEYLSLKVGNNSADEPEIYSVGPFYGRLFRQVEGSRTRYFGFIEDAEKMGEDENGQGLYERHWQVRVTAKPALSNDQRTRYISGSVMPSQQPEVSSEGDELPF